MKEKGLVPAPGDALIVVDVQNDFLEGGSLAVPQGEQVVPVLNKYLGLFRSLRLPIFATRDWHPADHVSFRAQGGPWPPHCVQGTKGAAFAPDLKLPPEAATISTASREQDAYSGFQETDLAERLRSLGVKRLFVGGLATDYCVKATVIGAIEEGFTVVLLVDAVKPVDVRPGDGDRAVEEMVGRGTLQADYTSLVG